MSNQKVARSLSMNFDPKQRKICMKPIAKSMANQDDSNSYAYYCQDCKPHALMRNTDLLIHEEIWAAANNTSRANIVV